MPINFLVIRGVGMLTEDLQSSFLEQILSQHRSLIENSEIMTYVGEIDNEVGGCDNCCDETGLNGN